MREKRAIIVDTIVRRYISNLAKSMTENSAKTVTKFTGILYEINKVVLILILLSSSVRE
jgi:ubiquitin C-terminal hydrolase